MLGKKLLSQGEALREAEEVLRQVQLHHQSLAKGASPCTQRYNKELADKCQSALRKLRTAFKE